MPLKWGILGAGNISGQFTHDLLLSNTLGENTHIVASIGSSLVEKGDQFIRRCNIALRNNQGYTAKAQNYQDFFANPDVQVVYIGTPHTFHKDQILQALHHGKHVVCEKPFTVTGAEAKEVFSIAEKKQLLVMEAVWTRFFPAIAAAKGLIFQGKVLGDVHRLSADFSMNADIYNISPSSRARDIALAAGATLDIGIYPLTYGRILLDELYGDESAFEAKSFLSLDPVDGVDHLSTILLKYKNGKQAVLTSSNYVDGPSPYLRLEGTKGYLEMFGDNPARARKFRVVFKDGEPPFEYEEHNEYIGFIHEANAAARAIEDGKKEADLIPWRETQLVMDTMDKVRWENNLYYPGEKCDSKIGTSG